ncbi:MAG: hypothetical protein R3C25_05140 [Hyphomonadaceae bacterium]
MLTKTVCASIHQDRIKDMICSAENIYPAEVENAISHPGVARIRRHWRAG